MIKKIISGLLSAVISTVMITADFDMVRHPDNRTLEKVHNTFSNDGMSVNSSNSLGNYISDAMQKEQPKNMAYQWRTDYDFDIGFAEFDRESGIMTIYSSQPDDAKIVIVVKDDESKEAVCTTELDVNKGENTINTVNIDVNVLPEFFFVELQLFDRYNKAVGQAYTLNSYTGFTQDMKATDIYDFEEEYVVNLDEDETTNFVVLNENTIKGESKGDKNILISADYHKDQYVFENIDDTIRYLSKGDHFFIQPTKNDIIALSVGDITIEGDRATLTGDENTAGIFDVIKIETSADDVSEAIVDEDSELENLEYNGLVENENGENVLEYSFENEYGYEAVDVNYDEKIEIEFKIGTEEDDEEESDKVDLTKPDFSNKKIDKGPKKIKVEGDLSGKLNFAAGFGFQFYQRWAHVDFEIKFSPSITIEVECAGKIEVPIKGAAHPIGFVVVPGLWFGFKPELSFKVEGSVKYTKKIGYDYVWSFDSSRDKMFSYTCKPIEDAGKEIKVEADIAITLDLQPMFYLFSDDVAAIILSMPIELGLNVSTNNLIDNLVSRSNTSSQTLLFKNIRGYDDDTAHTCKLCYDIKPYYSVKISLELEVKCIPFLDKITKTLFEYDSKDDDESFMNNFKMYCSVTHGVTDFGECPYKAYKTTFDLVGGKDISEAGAEISVDGVNGTTDNDGIINFYCENGSHNYIIYVDGKDIKTGSFNIDNATKYLNISLVDKKESVSDGSKIVTTAPIVTGFNMPSHTDEIPERSKDIMCIESGRLGDAIFYCIYANGEMNIYGSGKMYENAPQIKNISKVTTAYFIDNSPEKGKYITSISNGLFKDAKNLETVYLSNEIKSIGGEAFYNCINLKYFRYGGEKDTTETLILPKKLESIGGQAFKNCSSAAFGDLVFGDKFKSLGWDSFWDCKGITSVVIPANTTDVQITAFWGCSNIKTAAVYSDVDKIGQGLFNGCTSLEELTLSRFMTLTSNNNYAEIDELGYLFSNNGSSPSIDIPKKLEKIVILDGSVVADHAFEGFKNVKTIALPQGITKIGARAFCECSNADIICSDTSKELTFSELFADLESIGGEAFKGDSNIKIGDLVFGDKFKSLGWDSFWDCKGITSVVIPANTTDVQITAFWGCSNIKTAAVYSDVDKIGQGLFNECTSLEELTLSRFMTLTSNNNYAEIDELRYLFSTNGSSPSIKIPEKLEKIVILDGSVVADHAFEGFKNVKTIALPQGITKIGARAFYGCSNADIICSDTSKELTFSELFADLESIGGEAFKGDSNIKIGDLVFGDKFKSLGWDSFWDCKGITSVVIPANTTDVQITAFWGCSNIKTAAVYSDVDKIGQGLFNGCTSLEELTLSRFMTLTSNNNYAEIDELRYLFSTNGSSPSINIPEALIKITILKGEAIPVNCFNGYSQVKVLVLPSELTDVGRHATHDMTSLEEVYYDGPDEIWTDITEHALETENEPLYNAKRVIPVVEEHVYGDANGDGQIDMSDVVLIMQALSNPNRYGINGTDPKHITESGFKYADADGNGLTVNDAQRIQLYLLGKLKSLG